MAEWLTPSEIKSEINEIRKMTGDEDRISLINETKTDCPDCEFNTYTGESKDSSCPTCGGKGKISTETTVSLLAKIRWVDEIESQMLKVGYLPRGGVIFTLDNDYEPNVDEAERILIDGVEIKINGRDYRGSPKVNRVRFYAEPISKS